MDKHIALWGVLWLPNGYGTPPPVVLPFTYDHAGNLRFEDTVQGSAGRVYTHDAWSRLVKVEDSGAGGSGGKFAIQENQYNGLHWRTIATDTVTIDAPVSTKRFMSYSASWQLLEQDVDVAPTSTISLDRRSQQVWGIRYLDDAAIVIPLFPHFPRHTPQLLATPCHLGRLRLSPCGTEA